MVRVVYVAIYSVEGDVSREECGSNLKHFAYFSRSTILETLHFGTREVAERINVSRLSVTDKKLESHTIYARKRGDRVSILVADDEVPSPIAFDLLDRVLDSTVTVEDVIAYDGKVTTLKDVKEELDNTLEIVQTNIEKLLEKQDMLDQLVEKSSDLSTMSRLFYKKSKQMNSCCSHF